MTYSNENILNQELTEENVPVETTDVVIERKVYVTKADVLERLEELVNNAGKTDKEELEVLKQIFYKNINAEKQVEKDSFVETGGDPEAFQPSPDPDEDKFKQQIATIRKYRAQLFEEQEKQKKENLEKKLAIIDKVKKLVSTPEEANNSYDQFKALQAEWKEIKNVPADKANELWKNYQLYVEQFYDLLKQNSEMRAYDFKKNLEIKTLLCDAAEKLATKSDVIEAFRRLQELHQEYREVGPVAKEIREELWNRFKEASSVINKRHAAHFEELKGKEEENLGRKTALCEVIESININKLHTFSEWEVKTKEIIDLQAEWKKIGQTSKKTNTKIFERFRTACDNFFEKKTVHFKQQKEVYATNLAQKTALCEKVETLKESEDWASTSNKIIQIQKDWKKVGVAPKKASDALWLRFNQACNHFFERKNAVEGNQRKEQTENLTKKKEIINKLKSVLEQNPSEGAQQTVRSLMDEWNAVGHVPFKEKDKVYDAYRETVDKLFKELNIQIGERKFNSFKSDIQDPKREGSLSVERNKLFRAYELKRSEITTYENNMCFLSSNSKTGNSLVNEMQKKVDRLKDDLDLLQKKIAAVDEQIREQKK